MPRHRFAKRRIRVLSLSRASTHGFVMLGNVMLRCALGRSGRRFRKCEGDGATPSGTYPLRRVMVRRDRGLPPRTGLPVKHLQAADGWCDAAADRNYNRPVRHPYPASAERLWRSDGLYDLIVAIGHNERPRVRAGGSAIFIHLARSGFTATEGCVALRLADLRWLLGQVNRHTLITIA